MQHTVVRWLKSINCMRLTFDSAVHGLRVTDSRFKSRVDVKVDGITDRQVNRHRQTDMSPFSASQLLVHISDACTL